MVYERTRDHELDRVELQALIKSFELSYETGWNLMKDWFEYQGTTGISGSRDAIRQGFSVGLVADGSGWICSKPVIAPPIPIMKALPVRLPVRSSIVTIPSSMSLLPSWTLVLPEKTCYLMDISVYDSIEDDDLRDHIDRVGVSFYRVL